MNVTRLITRWFSSFRTQPGLDSLLGQAPAPTALLRQRLNWMEQLVSWIRTVGPNANELGVSAGLAQTVRLRHILQVLDRNLALKQRVADTLRSIIRDTRALELFMHVGIPNQQGFVGEFSERLNLYFLPQPPHDKDLVSVFSETFRFQSDSEWIRWMDPELFEGWLRLFAYSETPVAPAWNTLLQDARDALYLLGHSVRATGLSRLIRNRVKQPDFRKLPFYELTDRVDELLAANSDAQRTQAFGELNQNIDACLTTINEVYGHFRERGVSIPLVYQVERLKSLIRRMTTLARLLVGYRQDSIFIQEFFGLLVGENVRARSLRGLLDDNMTLVSQKIVETNAETGEHYITRDGSEYLHILKKSWGGGALTGFTILIKLLLHQLSLAPFISGVFAVANYSVSFVGMQLVGFTLATKQPAMTATALASKLQDSGDSVDGLVDEVVHLIRSQLAAVFGNITAVVPAIILIDWVFVLGGGHLADEKFARSTIESFSILGLTPFFAAWTGVLLWLSSVIAGWFGNWCIYRELPEATEHHPRLKFVFGAHRMARVADFMRHNIAGFAGNISLAFLLGMSTPIASFFGLPLDVRHVTLSSGSLAAAVLALGHTVFFEGSFWLAVGGIMSMAVLNLAVSFALALTVAIWATKASAPKRGIIYRALLKKFLGQPWIFFIPTFQREPIKE